MKIDALRLAPLLLVGAACSSSSGPSATSDAGTMTRDADARHSEAQDYGETGPGRRPSKEGGRDANGADASGPEAAAPDAAPSDDAGGRDDGRSKADAPRDGHGGNPADASAAGTCAGATCFEGQSCVSDACTFATCDGAKVPGDYATVQDAVTALLASGGTICLGASTYNETVTAALTGNRGADPAIVLQGLGPSQTILTGLTSGNGLTPSLTIKGISLGSLTLEVESATVDISACTLGPVLLYSYGDESQTSDHTGTVVLDEVELTGASIATGLTLIDTISTHPGSAPVSLTITNSYLHGEKTGVSITWGNRATETTGGDTLALTFANNTVEDEGTGVQLSVSDDTDGPPQTAASLTDNIFFDNTVALDTNVTVIEGNNAYYGNTTKFMGLAVPASGDVNGNPLLDTSTSPPSLLPGSPCRGAASPSTATAHDFWGRPRAASPDIGAVQSSP